MQQALIHLSHLGGGLSQLWKVDHSPSGGRELGRRGFGVVWALLSQDGAHTREDRTALLQSPVSLYVGMAAWYMTGQKPFLVLFSRLFG